MTNSLSAVTRIQEVIDALLAPNGCPWDKEQTPASLSGYIIEEAYELLEAIRAENPQEACSELGDVFFLLFFLCRLYSDKGSFTLEDVLLGNVAKMVRRHPHVFADTTFASREEQLREWERIKQTEKNTEAEPQGIFSSLPKGLPALLKAYRVHSKAARAGFTWDTEADVEQQVEAEWLELLDAFAGTDQEAQTHEFGDLLFTLVELGRRKGIKADAALDSAVQRFLQRFAFMENKAYQVGKDFCNVSMEEKNMLWEQAKEQEKASLLPSVALKPAEEV